MFFYQEWIKHLNPQSFDLKAPIHVVLHLEHAWNDRNSIKKAHSPDFCLLQSAFESYQKK